MATLVLSVQHRHVRQLGTRNENPVNCRSSESRAGMFPSPFVFTSGSSDTKHAGYRDPEAPYSCTPTRGAERTPKCRSTKSRSRSTPIPIKLKNRHHSEDLSVALRESEFFSASPSSELWAGPTYSNSPPPSSLPMPKFSLRQKRSVSLELPVPDTEFPKTLFVRSAPPSPSRVSHSSLSGSCFFLDTASATKDLRRILHLDDRDD